MCGLVGDGVGVTGRADEVGVDGRMVEAGEEGEGFAADGDSDRRKGEVRGLPKERGEGL